MEDKTQPKKHKRMDIDKELHKRIKNSQPSNNEETSSNSSGENQEHMELEPRDDFKFPMKARCDGILDDVPSWQRDNEYI